MAKTLGQVVAEALAEAKYCDQCGADFIDDSDKLPSNEYTVWFTGEVEIICQNCQDRAVDSYLDNYNA
jgi:hypothetical protein